MSHVKPLTAQQAAFADAVVKGASMREAFLATHPHAAAWKTDSVNRAAKRMAARPQVKARIHAVHDKVAEAVGIEIAEVLQSAKRIAMSDIGKIIGPGNKVLLPNELDDATRAAVASFKVDEYGRMEYKFWDKNAALEKLFKYLGLYKRDNEQQPTAQVITEIRLVPLCKD